MCEVAEVVVINQPAFAVNEFGLRTIGTRNKDNFPNRFQIQ
jgi:hypothetical protein